MMSAQMSTRFRKRPSRVSPLYYPELTGLRAVALALVFFHHCEKWFPGSAPIFQHGHSGVSLFFALSGYLITVLYYPRLTRGTGRDHTSDRVTFSEYLWRRFARIYPAYLVALLIKMAIDTKEPQSIHVWLTNLTLTQAFFFPDVWAGLSPVSWSLTVEESFYLMVPLIFFAVRPFLSASARLSAVWRALLSLSILAVISFALWCGVFLLDAFPERPILHGPLMVINVSILGRFGEFAMGMGVALLSLSGCLNQYWGFIRKRKAAYVSEVLAVASIGLGVATFLINNELARVYHTLQPENHIGELNRLLMAAAGALLILSVIGGSRLIGLILGNRTAVYLGRISYFAYLLNADILLNGIHSLFSALWPETTPSMLGTTGFYVFFSCFAALGYELIEKPAQRFLTGWWVQRKPG